MFSNTCLLLFDPKGSLGWKGQLSLFLYICFINIRYKCNIALNHNILIKSNSNSLSFPHLTPPNSKGQEDDDDAAEAHTRPHEVEAGARVTSQVHQGAGQDRAEEVGE